MSLSNTILFPKTAHKLNDLACHSKSQHQISQRVFPRGKGIRTREWGQNCRDRETAMSVPQADRRGQQKCKVPDAFRSAGDSPKPAAESTRTLSSVMSVEVPVSQNCLSVDMSSHSRTKFLMPNTTQNSLFQYPLHTPKRPSTRKT